ncbi:probable methyltransferase TCM_000168 isoform X1 [Mercurialis annua]|uniref:probable methyltransferase TCM_000168 isoform X1 n=1 Tax=Mercurialis annua TaxID=3986 RepID=UPI00215DDBD5|nr:probable methyltransferase TCM_000168 isoform X1 [Mercurialis annua]
MMTKSLTRQDLILGQQKNMENDDKKMHQLLHMKAGTGEQSYANNSKVQKAILSKASPVLVEALQDLCDKNMPEVMTMADLGCSSGPNSLFAATHFTNIICKRCSQSGRSPPELCVYMNDLPGHDFNTTFKSLPAFHEKMRRENGQEFGACYVYGVAGSFHHRLFPSNSLNFVHSSSALHWLSQVPPEMSDESDPLINKGKISISETSPAAVIKAYQKQFQKDFSSFLEARSKEVVPGGRMVLSFLGRNVANPTTESTSLFWDYIGHAFQAPVQQGVIEEEKLDTYNAPYYEASIEEVEREIVKEGSFAIDKLGSFMITWDDINGGMRCDRATTAMNLGKAIRAVHESMFGNHFGEGIMDPFIHKLREVVVADTQEIEHVNVVISLIRKG